MKFSNLRLVKLSIAEHRSIFWCMRNIIDHRGKYRITNENTVSLFKYSNNFIYSYIFLKGMGVCCTIFFLEFRIISLSHWKDFYMVQLRCREARQNCFLSFFSILLDYLLTFSSIFPISCCWPPKNCSFPVEQLVSKLEIGKRQC